MKKYKVEITETLQKIIVIDALSEEDAIEKVKSEYSSERIILDSNDFVDVEITFTTNHKIKTSH